MTEEVVPVEIKSRKGVELFAQDDHMRPDSTMEGLAKLPAAFSKNGCVTAGNASGIVDGGAALLLASAPRREGARAEAAGAADALGLRRRRADADGHGAGAGDAQGPRYAPGCRLKDIDLIEVNEAFAAQYLAVEKELGLDRDRVNVNGGAIALGHPLGMTGTRLLLTLTLELRAPRPEARPRRPPASAAARASPRSSSAS